MAFKISRRSWVLGRPCPVCVGMWGSMYFHSASDRSVGYLFLMRARVAKHPPRTTFHTASLRTWVNKGKKGPAGVWCVVSICTFRAMTRARGRDTIRRRAGKLQKEKRYEGAGVARQAGRPSRQRARPDHTRAHRRGGAHDDDGHLRLGPPPL